MRIQFAVFLGLVFMVVLPAMALDIAIVGPQVLKEKIQFAQVKPNLKLNTKSTGSSDKVVGEVIGYVNRSSGSVYITDVHEEKKLANTDMPIFLGDEIETGEKASIRLIFVDGTYFVLGSKGKIVMEKYLFKKNKFEGNLLFRVIGGTFSFVSGDIAKTGLDKMMVEIPVATIGVRGTEVAGWVPVEGGENIITLLPEVDGSVGKIIVRNSAGQQVMNKAFETTRIVSKSLPPSRPTVLSEREIKRLYGGLGGKTGAAIGPSAELFGEPDGQVNNAMNSQENQALTEASNQQDAVAAASEEGGDSGGNSEYNDAKTSSEDGLEQEDNKKKNEIVGYICQFEPLCNEGNLNWMGWFVLVAIIVLFIGVILLVVLILP